MLLLHHTITNAVFGCKELGLESDNLEFGIYFRRLGCALNCGLETKTNSEHPLARVQKNQLQFGARPLGNAWKRARAYLFARTKQSEPVPEASEASSSSSRRQQPATRRRRAQVWPPSPSPFADLLFSGRPPPGPPIPAPIPLAAPLPT
jgi:hypothetical protein